MDVNVAIKDFEETSFSGMQERTLWVGYMPAVPRVGEFISLSWMYVVEKVCHEPTLATVEIWVKEAKQ